mmetsp:Transcript_77460/g.185689  ORF Transcript_77460/g.185689 Transcript_77460/m.185689 type:complete len:386 (+) Transcript_77460:74-1231(+)
MQTAPPAPLTDVDANARLCHSLVSDLLKDDDAGEQTDVPEERSGELTINDSEEERKSPVKRDAKPMICGQRAPPGLLLSTASPDVNSLSSPSFHSVSTHMPGYAPTSRDDSPDEEEVLGASEEFDALYPVTAPPATGPEYDQWFAQLPSIGSANHFNGTCDRCCFHPKGRCMNGYNCQHCHFDHEKRKRKGKKRTERAEPGSEMGSIPPTPQGPHETFYAPALPVPSGFHDPGMEIPLPVPAYSSWYPEEAPVPEALYPGISPDPRCIHPRDEYVFKLEEENRFLRAMIEHHLGPTTAASLPPSIVAPKAEVAPVECPPGLGLEVLPEPQLAAPTSLSAGAAPFCPGVGLTSWSEPNARVPAGSVAPSALHPTGMVPNVRWPGPA